MASFTFKYAPDHHDLANEFRVLNFLQQPKLSSGTKFGERMGERTFMKCSLLAIDRDGAVEMRRGLRRKVPRSSHGRLHRHVRLARASEASPLPVAPGP